MFATYLDEKTIVIRSEPESPLKVLSFGDDGEASLVVSQPAGRPALSPRESDAVRKLFDSDEVGGFWWTTLRPARFTLERLMHGVWIGRLITKGAIMPVSSNPMLRPRGYHSLFGCLERDEEAVFRAADPIRLAAENDPDAIAYQSSAMRMVKASVPALRRDPLWARLYAPWFGRAEYQQLAAEEAVLLDALAPQMPSGPRILFAGEISSGKFVGLAVVQTRCIGLSPRQWRNAGGAVLEVIAGLHPVENVVRSLLGLAASAQERDLCIGPLAIDLVRLRPTFADGRRGLRVCVAALPGGGDEGASLPARFHEVLSSNDDAYWDPSSSYIRTHREDVRGIGLLATRFAADFPMSASLREFVALLVDGRFTDPKRALEAADVKWSPFSEQGG